MKKIIGGVVTLVIGGMVFSVSKADIAKNFSKDTGVSEQEAQQYIESIKQEDLVSFEKLGQDFINSGQELLKGSNGVDCTNYEYTWESPTLSCNEGKSQMIQFANDEIELGKAYSKLVEDTATEMDVSQAIVAIDKFNENIKLEIIKNILEPQTIDEIRKSSFYNKALLQTALESK